MALVVHPRYVLSTVPPTVYKSYKVWHEGRYLKSYKAMSKMMTTNTMVKIKEAPRIQLSETPVLLNSLARASPDKRTGSYTFKENQPTEMKQNLMNIKPSGCMRGRSVYSFHT
jgi:fatty acid synthase subunit alpha, fungi type